ncbi:MAG: phosphotransferase [Acidobacteria bacterium]|nr:phosphotransferase [Acidobacteriota bacterium]
MSSTAVEQDTRPVASQRTPQDLYRLLMLRNSGSELLVASQRPPFTLPCVEIPKWERVAENLSEAVRKRYGLSAICLFTPEPSDATANGEPPLYQVMETREAATVPSNEMRWLPLDSISNQPFADEQDLIAITDMLRQITRFRSGEACGPFGRPGWIEELVSWVERETEPYGLRLTGNFRQLNASPTFSLIRLETNAQAVWFKAVGEPNLREFSISAALAKLFPGFVPTVIAPHAAWHGWLTTEFPGSTLDEASDSSAWERAAHALAELQIVSVGHTDLLLDAGCRDLRVPSLLTLVDPFIEVMSQLMEQQQKTPPAALGRGELLTLGTQIKETLSELAELDIPDTLGHLDFNPGNILCSADQCVFLDWAEAYVGPPFPTFQYLLEHLYQTATHRALDSERLVDHYAARWLCLVSPSAVAAAQRMMPLVSVFACAVASDWIEALPRRDERFAGYLRSLTRRMQRESGVLHACQKNSRVGVVQ